MFRTSLLVLTLLLTTTHTSAEVKLEIGPDTTVIDGPINPDGTINYLAYLNEKLSEGVTPENNFAVDVAMTMGPDAWHKESFREKVLLALGVDMPVEGPFIIQIKHVIGEGNDVAYDDPRYQTWLDTISRPWTAEDHPEVKHWLDNQNEALDRIQKNISQKDRYYFPFIAAEGEPESIDMALLPWLMQLRGIARGFMARAELKVATGEIDDAWSDVRAIRLIANHSAQEPYTISWLVAVSIHGMSASVTEDIAGSEQLTSEHAKRMIVSLQKDGPIRPYREVIDTGMRLSLLDLVMHYWKGRGDQIYERLEYSGELPIRKEFYSLMETDQYDPNVTLRAVNDWAGRWVRAGQIEGYHERLAATDHLERVCKMQRVRALELLDGDPDAERLMRRKILASNKITVAVTSIVVDFAFMGRESAYKTEAGIKMKLALAPVVLAIGGYHAEHGEYPPDLHALVPAYLDSLPLDFATGELPVYRVEDGVAVVYSLGTDLEDDGGVDDPNEGDIVFRIERR